MAGTTSKGFRYPEDSDAPNIAQDIENLATDVDTGLDSYIAKSIVTAQGDLITASGSATPTRLGIGAEGTVLYSNGTAVSWAVDPTNDVVTTAGDLIYGTGADAVTRLGIGTAGQVLTVNTGATAPEWATPAGGKVLQVVSATFSTTESTNSSTFSDTAFTLNITPTAATSKILVLAHSRILGASNSAESGIFRLRRDTTDLTTGGTRGGDPAAPSNASPAIFSQWSCAYLDSPATTSTTTYLLRKAVRFGGGDSNTFGEGGNGTQITLIEIGA